ncbi:MAG: lyase family protein, partial [Fusobacterium necrophorum]|nr:lyase family protein [Fusobacterium necrophorum]
IQFLLRDLLKNLEDLYSTFQSKATQYDHIIKMGRTHLQDAVPIRVGQEFRAFSGPVKRDIERLKSAMYELSFVNMGATAVGTGLNADINYIQRVVEVLSEVTGFSFSQCEDLVDGTRNLDSFVYLSSILKTCAVNLSKTANDIRLMSSGPKAGIAELILPQEQPGSSIMPGKVNPVIPEVMNQVCFQIFGNDVTITKAAEAGQLELNVFEPVLFFNLFQSIQILTNGIRTFIDNCIAGIQVNEEDCKYWLTRSVGVVTALSPHIGYKVAAEIAKLSLKTGKPVYDLVLEQGLLEKEKLDIILNPFEMTKPGIAGKELLKHD